MKVLMKVLEIILHLFCENQSDLVDIFPSNEFFHLFLIFKTDEFQDKVNQNCSRRPAKGEQTTSNTEIVANMPVAATAAAVTAAAANSTFADTIGQIFTFLPVGRNPLLVKIL